MIDDPDIAECLRQFADWAEHLAAQPIENVYALLEFRTAHDDLIDSLLMSDANVAPSDCTGATRVQANRLQEACARLDQLAGEHLANAAIIEETRAYGLRRLGIDLRGADLEPVAIAVDYQIYDMLRSEELSLLVEAHTRLERPGLAHTRRAVLEAPRWVGELLSCISGFHVAGSTSAADPAADIATRLWFEDTSGTFATLSDALVSATLLAA